MLCWTCSECGQENSPALRECPSCPPATARPPQPAAEVIANRSNDGILALAHNLETIHAFPILSAVPEHAVGIRENGRSSHSSVAATLTEESHLESGPEATGSFNGEDDVTGATQEAMLVLAEETLAIPMQHSVDSLVRPLVESAALAETIGPVPEVAAEPETAAALTEQPAQTLEEAALEPAATLSSIAAEPAVEAAQVSEVPDAPETPRTESVSEVVEPAAEAETIERAANQSPLPEPVQTDRAPQETEPSPALAESERSDVPPSVAAAALTPEPVSANDSIRALATEPTQCEVLPDPPPFEPAPAPIFAVEKTSSAAAEPSRSDATEPVQSEPGTAALNSASGADSLQAVSEPPQPATLAAEPVSTAAIESAAVELAPNATPPVAELVVESIHAEPAPESHEPASTPGTVRVSVIELPPSESLAPQMAAEPLSTTDQIESTAVEPPHFETLPAALIAEPVGGLNHAEPALTADPIQASAVEPSPSEPLPAQVTDPIERTAVEPSRSEATPAARVAEPVVELTHAEPVPEAVAQVLSNDGFALEPPIADPGKPDLIAEATEVLAVPVSEAQLAIDWELPAEKQSPTVDSRAVDTEAFCAAFASSAEERVESIRRKLDIEYAAIRAIAASFERRSALPLLGAPPDIVTAPAPPIFETIGMRGPRMPPMAPPPANPTSLTSRHQPPTLAGPCLPLELRNPTESRVSKDHPKSRSMPGWVVSFITAMLLLLVGVTAYQYFNSQSGGGTASASTQSAPASGAAQADAAAKSLEISGLRLTKSWNGKQQVRFLIINHSTKDLSGVTAQVTVKSDGSPVLLIQAPIRSLASNQSEEIRTDLDSDVPASVLSDWQALSTEIRLTSQQ